VWLPETLARLCIILSSKFTQMLPQTADPKLQLPKIAITGLRQCNLFDVITFWFNVQHHFLVFGLQVLFAWNWKT